MTNLLHTKRVRNKTLLPFSVIQEASQGDEAAICCILKRYEGYTYAACLHAASTTPQGTFTTSWMKRCAVSLR